MAELEGIPKIGAAIVVCEYPDYVRSPTATVPYQVVAFFNEAVDVSPDVNFTGQPVTTMISRIPTLYGNEAGTAGIKSGVIKGWCRPIANASPTVLTNGNETLRHTTQFEMNLPGP